jgi:hypothetical protein
MKLLILGFLGLSSLVCYAVIRAGGEEIDHMIWREADEENVPDMREDI